MWAIAHFPADGPLDDLNGSLYDWWSCTSFPQGSLEEASMRIYFAGSIRGGREDAALYRRIIALLKMHGRVLTEHVGETGAAEADVSDEAIYQRDMAWLEEADVVVAEVTIPSHGVGYELARAETLGKPILCLYRPETGHHLSALIAGNPALLCEAYQRADHVHAILKAFLGPDTKPSGDQD